MKRSLRQFVMLALILTPLVFITGCFNLSAGPSGIAAITRPVPVGKTTVNLGPVVGDSWGFAIMGVVLGELSPTKIARDRALEKMNADALENVALENRTYSIGPITIFNAHIEGDAVKFQ